MHVEVCRTNKTNCQWKRFGDVGHGYMCTVGEKVRVRMRVRGHCMREGAMAMVRVRVRLRVRLRVRVMSN